MFIHTSEEIEVLAAKGVDLSARAGSGGLTAIHRAVLTGSTDALRAVRGVPEYSCYSIVVVPLLLAGLLTAVKPRPRFEERLRLRVLELLLCMIYRVECVLQHRRRLLLWGNVLVVFGTKYGV